MSKKKYWNKQLKHKISFNIHKLLHSQNSLTFKVWSRAWHQKINSCLGDSIYLGKPHFFSIWFISVKLCQKCCGLTVSASTASNSNLLYLKYRRTIGSNKLCDGGIMAEKHTFCKTLKLSGVSVWDPKLPRIILYSSEDEEEKRGKGGWSWSEEGWRGALTLIKPFLYS